MTDADVVWVPVVCFHADAERHRRPALQRVLDRPDQVNKLTTPRKYANALLSRPARKTRDLVADTRWWDCVSYFWACWYHPVRYCEFCWYCILPRVDLISSILQVAQTLDADGGQVVPALPSSATLSASANRQSRYGIRYVPFLPLESCQRSSTSKNPMKKIIVIIKTTTFIDIYDECYPKNFGAT